MHKFEGIPKHRLLLVARDNYASLQALRGMGDYAGLLQKISNTRRTMGLQDEPFYPRASKHLKAKTPKPVKPKAVKLFEYKS